MSHLELGPTFRKLRLEQRRLIKQAAAAIERSCPYIAHVESGQVSPQWKDVCKLSAFYGVDPEWVIADARARKW